MVPPISGVLFEAWVLFFQKLRIDLPPGACIHSESKLAAPPLPASFVYLTASSPRQRLLFAYLG